MARNHYELLGVTAKASQEELDDALKYRMQQYRLLISRGRKPDPKALTRIREAHALLSDPARRRAYDHVVFGGDSEGRGGSGIRALLARLWERVLAVAPGRR